MKSGGLREFPSISVLNQKYVDDVMPLEPIDYEDATNVYLASIVPNDDIIAVYQIGSVSCSGISDLDFWFVSRDQFQSCQPSNFRIDGKLDPRHSYAIWHLPIVAPQRLMEYLPYLFPVFNLQLLRGRAVPINPLSHSLSIQVSACTLADVILDSYPREFLKMQFGHTLSMRWCLARLNALIHAIRLLKMAGVIIPSSWEKYIQEVSDLRSTWFRAGSERYDAIASLARAAFDVSIDLIGRTAVLLEDLIVQFAGPDKARMAVSISGRYLAGDGGVIFREDWNPTAAAEQMQLIANKTGCYVNILPAVYGAVLCAYSAGTGRRSCYVRRHLDLVESVPGCNYQNTIPALDTRGRLLDEHLDFVVANRLWFGYFNTLGYYPTVRLKDKLIWLRQEMNSWKLHHRLPRLGSN